MDSQFQYQNQNQTNEQQQSQYRQVRVGENARQCFYCKSPITLTAEICPSCGRPTNPLICTFCGSEMDMNDRFCAECGNSREGIVCPDCGTLNFRSFCRKCNRGLDSLAQAEIERAKSDPQFKRICELQAQMALLEKQIIESAELLDAEEYEPEEQIISEQDKALLSEYEDLLNMIQGGGGVTPIEREEVQVEKKEEKKRVKININLEKMREITESYKQSAAQLNEMMENMLPDPGTTPQIQRNYYSARKLPVVTVTKTKELVQEPVEWICNYCGCHHKQPSECCEPQLGGTWVYKNYEVERIITTKTYKYED